MDEFSKKSNCNPANDRIEGDVIILSGIGVFPKKLIIILDSGKRKEYRIIKTQNGGYSLNK